MSIRSMRRRLPATEETELWRRAMRDVAPLPGRVPPPEPSQNRGRPARPAADAGETPAVPNRQLLPAPPPPSPAQPLDRFAGVDRATAERVRRGRYPLDGRLDLHGMTQDQAHRALSAFIGSARASGRRCVLVITGHGRMSGGILKAAVPRWLTEVELRPHVLASTPAQPQHGGDGALYVLLRRLR